MDYIIWCRGKKLNEKINCVLSWQMVDCHYVNLHVNIARFMKADFYNLSKNLVNPAVDRWLVFHGFVCSISPPLPTSFPKISLINVCKFNALPKHIQKFGSKCSPSMHFRMAELERRGAPASLYFFCGKGSYL